MKLLIRLNELKDDHCDYIALGGSQVARPRPWVSSDRPCREKAQEVERAVLLFSSLLHII